MVLGLRQDASVCEQLPERVPVPLVVSPQALPPIAVEITRPHDQQQQTMLRDFCLAPKVVEPPLFAASNAADRRSTVKEGHGLIMLTLAELDDELMSFIPGIHWQLPAASLAAGVANKPRKAVLPFRTLAKQFVTEFDDIRLVALAANHAKNLAPIYRIGRPQLRGSSREQWTWAARPAVAPTRGRRRARRSTR